MLITSGQSSAYIFSSDSTARKARVNCLHADSIVTFDHGQCDADSIVPFDYGQFVVVE
jgi:hypothetical protein